MSAPAVLLSFVCPVFKEEAVLPAWHNALTAVLTSLEPGWRAEILYVDDGSPDQSLDVIKKLGAQDARVCFLALSRRFGTEAALLAGLEHARGDLVITLDTRCRYFPQLIPAMLKKWREGCEVVVADQDNAAQPGRVSRIFFKDSQQGSPVPTDCCLLSRKAVRGLLRLRESNRSLRGLVGWLGFPTGEVSFKPQSSSTGSRPASPPAAGLLSTGPLRLASYLGGAAILVALAHAAWLVLMMGLGRADATPLWNYLVIAVQLMGGAILCCLGIMGEYVGRIFEQVKKRPNSLFKDQSPEELPLEQEQPAARHAA